MQYQDLDEYERYSRLSNTYGSRAQEQPRVGTVEGTLNELYKYFLTKGLKHDEAASSAFRVAGVSYPEIEKEAQFNPVASIIGAGLGGAALSGGRKGLSRAALGALLGGVAGSQVPDDATLSGVIGAGLGSSVYGGSLQRRAAAGLLGGAAGSVMPSSRAASLGIAGAGLGLMHVGTDGNLQKYLDTEKLRSLQSRLGRALRKTPVATKVDSMDQLVGGPNATFSTVDDAIEAIQGGLKNFGEGNLSSQEISDLAKDKKSILRRYLPDFLGGYGFNSVDPLAVSSGRNLANLDATEIKLLEKARDSLRHMDDIGLDNFKDQDKARRLFEGYLQQAESMDKYRKGFAANVVEAAKAADKDYSHIGFPITLGIGGAGVGTLMDAKRPREKNSSLRGILNPANFRSPGRALNEEFGWATGESRTADMIERAMFGTDYSKKVRNHMNENLPLYLTGAAALAPLAYMLKTQPSMEEMRIRGRI